MRSHEGHSPLDLHCMRWNIPGEVQLEEFNAWRAVQELLFSYEAFPIVVDTPNSSFNRCRMDVELVDRFVQMILKEGNGKQSKDVIPPLDPSYNILPNSREENSRKKGLIEKQSSEDNLELSDVANRIWIFLVTFTNSFDQSDHYANLC